MSFPLINPYQQFVDSSGNPLSSGTVTFYDPSTAALVNTYPTADDADASTNANSNPITLNSSGAASSGIFLQDGVKYKVVLADSDGNNVGTWDDVRCPQYTAPETTITRGTGVGALNLKGYSPTPVVGIQNYTITNLTVDRTLNCDSTTTAELADLIGTLVRDLKEKGSL